MGAGTAMAIAGGVSAISSGALAIGGNKRRKRAEAELRNLVPPELRNYYSDVPVSTMGSRIASQNMAQNNSNMLAAGQRGGIRALSAIAPTLTEANIQQNQAIAQDIDRQYRENKMNEAQGGMAVQQMKEQRYQGALAGLQAERAAGLQDTYTGLQNIGSTALGVATGIQSNLFQNKQLDLLGKQIGNNRVVQQPQASSAQFPQGTGPYQYEDPSFVPYPARVGSQNNQLLYFPVGEKKGE